MAVGEYMLKLGLQKFQFLSRKNALQRSGLALGVIRRGPWGEGGVQGVGDGRLCWELRGPVPAHTCSSRLPSPHRPHDVCPQVPKARRSGDTLCPRTACGPRPIGPREGTAATVQAGNLRCCAPPPVHVETPTWEGVRTEGMSRR